MAAVALNTFKTIRHLVTDTNVGIYTSPIGVASIILYAQAVHVAIPNICRVWEKK